jgi:hypothetical protein
MPGFARVVSTLCSAPDRIDSAAVHIDSAAVRIDSAAVRIDVNTN